MTLITKSASVVQTRGLLVNIRNHASFKSTWTQLSKFHQGVIHNSLLKTSFSVTTNSKTKIINHLQLATVPNRCCWSILIREKSSSKIRQQDKFNLKKIMEADTGMEIAGYQVIPWSISGLETCVVLQKDDLLVAFDMGYAFRQSVKCQHVFISHGHMDHVSGLLPHLSKRGLYNLKPATYYTPPHLEGPLQQGRQAAGAMHGHELPPLNINVVRPDSTVKLSSSWSVRAFPTEHRVPSQGYIVYHTSRKLKPEYRGLGAEVGKLVKQGVDVYDFISTPEVAYTGDTTFDVFLKPPTPDLLKVKLLITEATYVDQEVDKRGCHSRWKARDRGHCHLIEFVENQELFNDVKNILLIHFSDKYSTRFVRKMVEELVPEEMREKIHLGVQLKERNEKDPNS